MPGQIKEIKNLKEALKAISHNTWVILDLDNTVMESCLGLGGDAWFSSLLSHATQHISDKNKATALVVALYRAIQFHVRTQAVEPEIVNVIKALQDIGVPVIGLTARDYLLKRPTVRQLADIGIDFSRHCIPLDSSIYEDGIIYCDGCNKGEMLKLCLEQYGAQFKLPPHIVMLDDKQGHLVHVQEVVEQLGIKFTGLRYGFLDDKVKQFDMRKSNVHLAHIKTRLPADTQAAIEQLQLQPHSEDLAERLSPSSFAHGFFASSSRSQSASSFFDFSDIGEAKTLS